MKLICKLIIIFSVLGFIWSCESPDSLEPVAGVEGKLFIEGEWPDSIQAVALIVLKSLDPGNLAAGLVSYSTPMLSPSKNLNISFNLSRDFILLLVQD